jgi:hypothetical protein
MTKLADEGRVKLSTVVPFADSFEAVYFVRAHRMPLVKIGWSSGVRKRIDELQTCCPFPLELVAQVPGSIQLEQSLHRRFSSSRMRAEWFYLTDPVVKFIRAQAATMKTTEQAAKEREAEIAAMDRVDRISLTYRPRPPRIPREPKPQPPPERWAGLREQIAEDFASRALRRRMTENR